MALSHGDKRQVRIVLIMILALVGPTALIYVFYVHNQRDYFTERNLRLLSLVSKQIIAKVESYADIVKSAVDTDLMPVSEKDHCPAGSPAQCIQDDLEGRIPKLDWVSRPKVEPESGSGSDYMTFGLMAGQSAYWVQIRYERHFDKTHQVCRLSLRLKVDDLVRLFASKEAWVGAAEFDALLVARKSDGAVVYQNEDSSLRASDLNGLQGTEKENGKLPTIDLRSMGGQSSAHSVMIGGDSYDLFLQPLSIRLAHEGEQHKDDGSSVAQGSFDELVVCGLVRGDHFRYETNAISPNSLIFIVFAIIISALSFPLLKLWLMRPTNRLHATDVGLMGISLVLGCGLVTIGALQAWSYWNLRKCTDAQLKNLAEQINKGLTEELAAAADQLQAEIGSEPFQTSLKEFKGRDQIAHKELLYSERVARNGEPFHRHYFENIVAADDTGMQRFRLTAGKYSGAWIVVKDRDYFKNAQSQNLWALEGTSARFFAQPITLRAFGNMLTAISVRLENAEHGKDANRRVEGSSGPSQSDKDVWVAVLSTRLLSVTATVIPDGFDFAVIDRAGGVLYDSDDKRALQENLFKESDDDVELQTLAFTRTFNWLNIHYMGRPHRAYTRPVANMPWTLVVLMDDSLISQSTFDTLMGSTALLFGYSLFLAFVVYWLCPLYDRSKSEWVWPASERALGYKLVIIVNLLLSAAFLVLLMIANGWTLLAVAALIPVLGVTLAGEFLGRRVSLWITGLVSKPPDQSGQRLKDDDRSPLSPSDKRQYRWAAATSILLLSMLPSAAWFKTIHNREMRRLVRMEQVSIAERIVSKESARDSKAVEKCRDADWSGNYHELFFDTKNDPPGNSPGQNRQIPNSENSLETFLALFSPPASRRLDLIKPLSSYKSDDLGTGAGTQDIEFTRANEHNSAKALRLKSTAPMLGPGSLPVWPILLILLYVLLLVVLWRLLGIISRRVFLIDLKRPIDEKSTASNAALKSCSDNTGDLTTQPSDNQPQDGSGQLDPESKKSPAPYRESMAANSGLISNLLVLLTSRNINPAAKLNLEGVEEIDFAQLSEGSLQCSVIQPAQPKSKAWRNWIDLKHRELLKKGAKSVAIRNFDVGIENRELNTLKLSFLHDLSSSGIKLIVLSAVDPLSPEFQGLMSNANCNGRDVASGEDPILLQRVFSSFVRVHIEDVEEPNTIVSGKNKSSADDQDGEFGGLQRTVAFLSQTLAGSDNGRARPPYVNPIPARYNSIWLNCTPEERLALCYVARDRFVDANNPALQDLLGRGLVVLTPDLQPMSPLFTRFIFSKMRPEEIKAAEAEPCQWNALRMPLMVGLAIAVIFLFYTQENLFNSAMGIVAVLTGSIPAILNATKLLRGGGASVPSP